MSDTPYIKNCNIGTATLDLPDFFYKHTLNLTSIGSDAVRVPIGIAYHPRSHEDAGDTRFYGKNLFGILPGMKLTVQKKIVFPEESSSLKPALVEEDGSITEFIGKSPTYTYTANDRSGRILRIATDGSMTLTFPSQEIEEYNARGDLTAKL